MPAMLLEPKDDVLRFDDAMSRYEIIDGVEVEIPPMSIYSDQVGLRTYDALRTYLSGNDIGLAQHEILFRLGLPKDRNRRPDVSFVSYERWPKDRPFPYRGNALDVVPDLAIEVVSPNDLSESLSHSLYDYFRAGVRLVWIIHPSLQYAQIYTSFKNDRILTIEDNLDAGDVLPGIKIPLASLFPATLMPEA